MDKAKEEARTVFENLESRLGLERQQELLKLAEKHQKEMQQIQEQRIRELDKYSEKHESHVERLETYIEALESEKKDLELGLVETAQDRE